MMDEMSCRQCQARLLDYLSSALADHEHAQVAQHLATCEDCMRDLAAWRAISTAVQADYAHHAPPVAVSERMWAAIEARIVHGAPGGKDAGEDLRTPDTHTAPAYVTSRTQPSRYRRGIFPFAALLLCSVLLVTFVTSHRPIATQTPAQPMIILSGNGASPTSGWNFTITALDPQNGQELWRFRGTNGISPTPGNAEPPISQWLSVTPTMVYVMSRQGAEKTARLIALRRSNGAILWESGTSDRSGNSTMIAAEEGIALCTSLDDAQQTQLAYYTQTGERLWMNVVRGSGCEALAFAPQRLLAALYQRYSNAGSLIAFDLATGRQSWNDTVHAVGGPILIHGSTLLFGGVLAFNLANGRQIWGQNGTLLEIVGDRVLVFAQARCIFCPINVVPYAQVAALNVNTGQLIWKQRWQAGSTEEIPYRFDDQVVAIEREQILQTFRIADGKPLWHAALRTPSPLLIDGGLIFVIPTGSGNLLALQENTGKVAWESEDATQRHLLGVADGLVVVSVGATGEDGIHSVTALREGTGVEAWTAAISGQIFLVSG